MVLLEAVSHPRWSAATPERGRAGLSCWSQPELCCHTLGMTVVQCHSSVLSGWLMASARIRTHNRAAETGHGTVRCQCWRCDTILVSLTYAKVQSGRGCHVCRPPATGFDRTAPGAVYVLQHDELAAVKIGVTVVGAERIRQRRRSCGLDAG